MRAAYQLRRRRACRGRLKAVVGQVQVIMRPSLQDMFFAGYRNWSKDRLALFSSAIITVYEITGSESTSPVVSLSSCSCSSGFWYSLQWHRNVALQSLALSQKITGGTDRWVYCVVCYEQICQGRICSDMRVKERQIELTRIAFGYMIHFQDTVMRDSAVRRSCWRQEVIVRI